jgi:antitoxin HicB
MAMTKALEEYMSLRYPVKLEPREDGSYFATNPDLQGCMAQGTTADEAVRNLRDSREVWIEARLKGGYGVPEPAAEDEYSGRLQLRMSPRLHSGLSEAAANENVSLNQLITGVLSQYLGGVQLRDQFADSLRRMQEGVITEIAKTVEAIRTAPSQSALSVRSAASSVEQPQMQYRIMRKTEKRPGKRSRA